MKRVFKSKPKWLIALVVIIALVIPSTAFALTATDFFQEAASWSYQNCRSVSTTNRLNNTVCFLLKQQEDNQYQRAAQNSNNNTQQQSIDQLNLKAKQPTLLDGNNNILGILISPSAQAFYNPTLNRVVNFNSQTVGAAETIWYQSDDCSGTPYINGVPGEASKVSLLFSDGGHNNYFIVAPNTAFIHNMNVQSIRQQGDGVCVVHTDSVDSLELTPVNLPFTFPFVQSIHLNYQ